MNTITTDVLAIGSGFGAAAPALRLSEAGFRVLMIERGKNFDPWKDFKQTNNPQYLLEYIKGISSNDISFTYAEALGGGSGFYEMVSLRAPSRVFEQRDVTGRSLWPAGIERATLDPYYDVAERMLNVEQIETADVPRSGLVFSTLMKNLGYSCDRARYAVKSCQGSGYCVTGCVFGAKQSLLLNYLPQARAAGMEVRTEIDALAVRPSDIDRDAAGAEREMASIAHRYDVVCRDRRSDERFTIRAKLVILGGGTVGTAALLLRSRRFMPLLSDHVGKNIAFNGSVKAVGLLPEGFTEGDMLSGRSHPGMISYEFFPSRGLTISCAKPLPLVAMASARLVLEGETRTPDYWGQAHVELMKQFRRRMIVLYALGLTPPAASIMQTGEDSFAPVLTIDDELRTYYESTKALLHSIFTRNGCRVVHAETIDGEGTPYPGIHYDTAHMIGSCRMAERKRDGVVDAHGEVFDYPGLYVADGAAIPSSLAVNSSLTILANAERIAAHLVRRHSPAERLAVTRQ